MTTDAQEGILQTIAFFDVMDMALTDTEVHELLFGSARFSYEEFFTELSRLIHAGIVERVGAYVLLPGRRGLIQERVSRGMLAEAKFSRARRAASLLRWIPFIRMIGVCNTLAFDMCRSDGDIDLFIISKKGKIATVRFFVTLVLHLVGLRRHGLKIDNRLCLSFFVSEEGCDMSRFSIADRDPYLAVWTRQVIPLFSLEGTYEKFWEANRFWLKGYFPEPIPFRPLVRMTVSDSVGTRAVRSTFEKISGVLLPWLERPLLLHEKKKLHTSARRRMRSEPHDVVVDERTLKFHEEDRRMFYKTRMEERLSSLQQKLI